jgi:cyclophilin family peptidyl-prolyl cis-trans isomerase
MQPRRRKSHNLRNAIIAIIVLMFIISIVVLAYQMNAPAGPPTYSDVSSSSTTNAGLPCTFSVLWADDANVSGYIFETNNTGVFVNDTWTLFFDFTNQTSAYATVTKTLNTTVGNFVSWRFWCNDTGNRWTAVPLQSLLVVSKVLLETSMGNIEIQLYGDMPITTSNFMNLVGTGVYDNTTFSRVAQNFVIQGGDATPKGITVPPIADELPNKHSNVRGSVAMAKTSQPNSATSQFYINLNDSNAATLDSDYSVFGTVISGMDVVDRIGQVPITATDPSNPTDGTPVEPVTITVAQFTG